jgi:hypothetical protein
LGRSAGHPTGGARHTAQLTFALSPPQGLVRTIAAFALITGTLAALAISGLIGLIPFFIFFYLLLKAL